MGPAGAPVLAVSDWTIAAVVTAVILLLGALYNQLLNKRVRCREAWTHLDVQLRRRSDQVAALIRTLRTRLPEGTATLERLEAAHAAAGAAAGIRPRARAEEALAAVLREALAVPPAATEPHLARLREELTSTDNRIAFARRQYNDFAAEYNAARRTLPASLMARLLRLEAQDPFEPPPPEGPTPAGVE